jgi:hypothetical protein
MIHTPRGRKRISYTYGGMEFDVGRTWHRPLNGHRERMSRMNYPPLPPATVLKLEPPKAVYRVFRLVSAPPKVPATWAPKFPVWE